MQFYVKSVFIRWGVTPCSSPWSSPMLSRQLIYWRRRRRLSAPNRLTGRRWWAASASRCLPLRCTSCTDLLAFLAPSKYPTAFTTGDGAIGDTNDLANVRNIHCFQRLAFGITDIIVGIALCHEKVAAPPFQFTHTTARETEMEHHYNYGRFKSGTSEQLFGYSRTIVWV